MKICVVTPRFTISGVPLAQVRFARAWAEAGHEVDLIIGYVEPGKQVPALPGVNLITLQIPHVRKMVGPIWSYLRHRKPDIVFSAEDHLNALVLIAAILAGSKAKISGSSRVTPFDTYSSKVFSKRWFLKNVVRAVMWRADALTCVSRDMVDQYRQVFRNPPHVCVYNIVDDRASRARILEAVDDSWFTDRELPVVVGAGMLAPWKGFPDLIRAIRILADRGRQVRLVIFGEGAMRAELEALTAELALGDLVRLPGHEANVLRYFRRADAFVLSSHVEGMPNVLVEAMMCGCTPVAADCPTGPRELLQDGRYGYLVAQRDPHALADGIAQALDHPIPANRLGEAVLPFEESVVLKRHFETLGLAAPT